MEREEEGECVHDTYHTKRTAEELTDYRAQIGIRVRYMHADIDVIERTEILRDLRLGRFDVLVGINLLREGLDLPEVSLVAILDADKEGFLRDERSLIQTIGRAARNADGKAIMYAERVTGSMRRSIDETNRRGESRKRYNEEHGITQQTIVTSMEETLSSMRAADARRHTREAARRPSSVRGWPMRGSTRPRSPRSLSRSRATPMRSTSRSGRRSSRSRCRLPQRTSTSSAPQSYAMNSPR